MLPVLPVAGLQKEGFARLDPVQSVQGHRMKPDPAGQSAERTLQCEDGPVDTGIPPARRAVRRREARALETDHLRVEDVLFALIARDEVQLRRRAPTGLGWVVKAVRGRQHMALAYQKASAVAAAAQIDATHRAPRVFQGVDDHSLRAGRGRRHSRHKDEQRRKEEAPDALSQGTTGQGRLCPSGRAPAKSAHERPRTPRPALRLLTLGLNKDLKTLMKYEPDQSTVTTIRAAVSLS